MLIKFNLLIATSARMRFKKILIHFLIPKFQIIIHYKDIIYLY